MSEAVRDLIQQALDQDYTKAGKTFGDVMTVKLDDLLDQEKIRLADQIYNGVDPDEEDPDESQLELDLEGESELESEEQDDEEDGEIEDNDDDDFDEETVENLE